MTNKEQLEAIEINLESQLFSWGSLKEPFGKLSVWRTRGCCRLILKSRAEDMEKRRIW